MGLVASLIFIWLNIKAGKSLTGSFFKKYYRYLTLASLAFGLGWATEFLANLGLATHEGAEFYHHIILLIAGAIFVASSLHLPKEAAQYMKVCETKPENENK